ncbi:MAG: FHA domain-containing protein [Woeseiaceae bacterium]|nr:FHA domain-containing protein [Woeseiaceae bacterium]
MDSQVSNIDDDPTEELEALTDTPVHGARTGTARESDEHTSNFDDVDDVDDIPVSRLRTDLRARNDSIIELQYLVEQLRSRSTGLDKELKAREELTDHLQSELGELKLELEARAPDTAAYDEDIASLRKQLAQQALEFDALTAELAEARAETVTSAARFEALEQQHATDTDAIRMLEENLEQFRARDVPAPADSEPAVHARSELSDLHNQIRRTESYADGLRRQLQDARGEAQSLDTERNRLQQALDNAEAQIRDLSVQLEDERLTKADVLQQKEEMQHRLDGEIDRLRSDLESALAANAVLQGTNDDLASSLYDSQSKARTLEDHLQTSEQRYAGELQDLEKRDRQQRQKIDELSDRLAAKDSAISALLHELASKQTPPAQHDDTDHGAQEPAARDGVDRDRCTRLLVGTIDGQKLRFPLFKDRLTIGRAADNDIQLKTQCISRRHAVINLEKSGCHISDRGSRNGIYVNDVRVKEALLDHGDRIVIGTAALVYRERTKR